MNQKPIKITPSILSADFGFLDREAKKIEQAGADAIHIDIMDGHFVPNLTLGPKAVAAINRATDLFLDVHIMVYNPFDYIESLVEAGADRITFHFEATEDVADTLEFIRKCNVLAGLSFRPETSESMIINYLDKCDLMLFMTVNPGFGGQVFMPEVVEKVKFARQMCDKLKIGQGGKTAKEEQTLPPFDIQVDGGINLETAKMCIEAGANDLVSGTWLFEGDEMSEKIRALKNLGKEIVW